MLTLLQRRLDANGSNNKKYVCCDNKYVIAFNRHNLSKMVINNPKILQTQPTSFTIKINSDLVFPIQKRLNSYGYCPDKSKNLAGRDAITTFFLKPSDSDPPETTPLLELEQMHEYSYFDMMLHWTN